MKKRTANILAGAGIALCSIAVIGCGSSPEVPASSALSVPDVKVPVTAEAGVPVSQSTDEKAFASLVANKSFVSRPDPFALRPSEQQYEKLQESLRLFGETGGFRTDYTPPEEKVEEQAQPLETQPYRRLAGIVVGDSIFALIDMGDGQLQLIRPGQQIPNSEWTVVSIDSEKAVLRRSGNVRPRQIVVPLEAAPPSVGGAQGGGPPGGGSFGGPNGPGFGRPGGAGGRGRGGGSASD